jgi:hypothetical protein
MSDECMPRSSSAAPSRAAPCACSGLDLPHSMITYRASSPLHSRGAMGRLRSGDAATAGVVTGHSLSSFRLDQ